MIYLYLFIVLLLIIVSGYLFLLNNNNKKNNNKKNNNNEKFNIVTTRGINRKLYLNPPTNANKYGIIDTIATFKCQNENCTIEEFSNLPLENDDIINNLVIQINTLVNNIDILTQGIQEKINTYNGNYSTFKTKLNESITIKQDRINNLVRILGFNIVDSTTPISTTSTTSSTPTPIPNESFTNITDRLRNSGKKIDTNLLPYKKGHFILT
jgi:hypothetical protein